MKNWCAKNKDRRIASGLRLKYGLSLEEYDRMLQAQNNLCAICTSEETAKLGTTGGAASKLSVDHNHGTGAVRGLLCSRCNTGLGCFKDDILRLEAAVAYLRKHGGSNV